MRRELALLVVLFGTLPGCGQKGPLWLPPDPAAQQDATTAGDAPVTDTAADGTSPEDAAAEDNAREDNEREDH